MHVWSDYNNFLRYRYLKVLIYYFFSDLQYDLLMVRIIYLNFLVQDNFSSKIGEVQVLDGRLST